MAKIIRCTDEVVELIPNIMNHVYEYFGEKELIIYAVLDDNEISFIVCDNYNCIYIKKEYNTYSITPFKLKEDKSIGMIKLGDNSFFYSDEGIIYMVDKTKREHMVGTKALSHEDIDGYDGFVYYVQYNPENDTMCDIRYQQMYRTVDGKPHIYSFHTKTIDVLSIDEQYSQKGADKQGFLTGTSKYFTKYEFNSEEIGYTLSAIKDYGVLEVLLNGAYNLQKSNKVVRYVKTSYVQKDGNYFDLWPFARQLNPEQLQELIKQYGFEIAIPSQLLDFYNDDIPIVRELQKLVSEIHELDKSDDNRKCLRMQLVAETVEDIPS